MESYRPIDGLLKKQLDSPIEDPVMSLKNDIEYQCLGRLERVRIKHAGRRSILPMTLPRSFHRYQYNIGQPIDEASALVMDREYSRSSRSTTVQASMTNIDGSALNASQVSKEADCIQPSWRQRSVKALIRLEKQRFTDFRRKWLPAHYRRWQASEDARYRRWSEHRKRLIKQYEIEYAAYYGLNNKKARQAKSRLRRVEHWEFRAHFYVEPKYQWKYVDLERGVACKPCSLPVAQTKTWFLPCNHTWNQPAYCITDFEGMSDRFATRYVGEETYERTSYKFRHALVLNGVITAGKSQSATLIPATGVELPAYNSRIDSLSLTRSQLDDFVRSRLPATMEKLSLFEIVEDLRESITSLSSIIQTFNNTAMKMAKRGAKKGTRITPNELRDWNPFLHTIASQFRDGATPEQILAKMGLRLNRRTKGGVVGLIKRCHTLVKQGQYPYEIAKSLASTTINSYQFYRFAIKSGVSDGVTVGGMVFSPNMGDYGKYISKLFNSLGRTKSFHVKLREQNSVQMIEAAATESNGQFNRLTTRDGGLVETVVVDPTSAQLGVGKAGELARKTAPVFRVRTHNLERVTLIAQASLVNLLGLDVNPYSWFTQGYLMLHYMGFSLSGLWQSIRYTYIIDKVLPWIRSFLEDPRYSFIQCEYRVKQYGESRKQAVYVSIADGGFHYTNRDEHDDDLGFHNVIDDDASAVITHTNLYSGKEICVRSRFRRSLLKPGSKVWTPRGKECSPNWTSFLSETAVNLAQHLLS